MPPPSAMSIDSLLGKINLFILNPVIVLLFALALLIFLWGIFQFIRKTDDVAERAKGQRNIFWGLVGMFIMFAVFAIIRLILNSVGISVSGQFPF